MNSRAPELLVGWTTVGERAVADRLGSEMIERHLAVCVQIDGPIISYYPWQEKTARAEEFRLTVKFVVDQLAALENYLRSHHPYGTPEWVVVAAHDVGEKYLSWAKANSSTPPL